MLFKDEVRAVGAELACPNGSFGAALPRPGLAIRIVGGEATKARLDLLRDADHILQDEIRKAGLYRELWQSFCVSPTSAPSVCRVTSDLRNVHRHRAVTQATMR